MNENLQKKWQHIAMTDALNKAKEQDNQEIKMELEMARKLKYGFIFGFIILLILSYIGYRIWFSFNQVTCRAKCNPKELLRNPFNKKMCDSDCARFIKK